MKEIFIKKTEALKSLGNNIFSFAFLILLFIPFLHGIFTSSRITTQSIIGKNQMLSLVNDFKYYVLKDKIYNGFIADSNGWLIYTQGNSVDNFQHTDRFTDGELAFFKGRLDYLCSSLTENGIRLIIIVPPNKNTTYPEYMPSEIPVMKNDSQLDQVISVWNDSPKCKMIDIRSTLTEAKKNYPIFYSTDTHWTEYGALLTYQKLSQVMQSDFSAVKVRPITDFNIIPNKYKGDLTSPVFGNLDLYEDSVILQPKFTANYIYRDYGPLYNVSDYCITNSTDAALPRAIIYHDSFFDSIIPLLGENFYEASYFWSQRIDLPWVEEKKPDYLILEMTERVLRTQLEFLPGPTQS